MPDTTTEQLAYQAFYLAEQALSDLNCKVDHQGADVYTLTESGMSILMGDLKALVRATSELRYALAAQRVERAILEALEAVRSGPLTAARLSDIGDLLRRAADETDPF